MALTIQHAFTSTLPDDAIQVAAGKVVPSNWNAAHTVNGTLPMSQITGNLPVSQLANGTGASVSTFWRGDGAWAAVVSGTSLGWFNVLTYGATGNGSSDDTAAVNLAIVAINAAGAGVLYFPSGTYLCTSGLTTITASGMVFGDGVHASVITCNSQTANLFTTNLPSTGSPLFFGAKLVFRNLTISNTAGSPPSAGSGILSASTSGGSTNFQDIRVEDFYIGVDNQSNSEWTMLNCEIVNPVFYGLRIKNTNPDIGDWSIVGLNTFVGDRSGATAIRIESSGGGKISNLKINYSGSTGKYAIGIDLEGDGSTADFALSNFSIENFTDTAIKIDGQWPNVAITNGEIGTFSSTQNFGISVNNNTNIAISNVIMHGDYVPLSITSNTNVSITNIIWDSSNSAIFTGNAGLIANNLLTVAGQAPIGTNSGNTFGNANTDLLGAVQGNGYATIVNGCATAGGAFPGSWGVTSRSSGHDTLIWVDGDNNFLKAGVVLSLGKTEYWRMQVLGQPNNDFTILTTTDFGVPPFAISQTHEGDITILNRRLVLAASNTTTASLNIVGGSAPTSPQDGDMWYDGANVKFRVGGSTKTFTLT